MLKQMGTIGALLVWGLTLLAGCGTETGSQQSGRLGSSEDFTDLGLTIELDPEMKEAQRDTTRNDLLQVRNLQIDVSESRTFQAVFGSAGQDGVLRYIDDRINFLLPPQVNLDARLQGRSRNVQMEWMKLLNRQDDDESGRGDSGPQIMATNIGTVLWLIGLAENSGESRFLFGDRILRVQSSRVGLILLGDAYFDKRVDPLDRTGTIIHEARHSDCTGGLTQADLALIRADKAPTSVQCGHLHEICPPDHPFAGLAACDSHAWGAYAIQAVYFAALTEACRNCTEEQRQVAQAIGVDSLSRVLVLEEMLDGRLGPPDMKSTTEVRP